MRPTEIVRVTVEAVDLALPRPFETAAARRTVARNVRLALELANGARGTGEVSPAPHVTGEDQEGTRSRLEAFAGALVGRDVLCYRAVSEAFREAHPAAPAARAGLESALLDACCRHLGVPLFQFLGGAATEVWSDVTVPIVGPVEAAEAARQAVAEGFTHLKVKVGGGGHDLERTLAVAEAAPGVPIRLDGNQGFTPEGAVEFIRRVLDAGVPVALYEQPVPRGDLEGMRFVRERAGVPVAADESVVTAADAYRVAQCGAADVVNIKLMKSGLLGALDIVGVCRAAGLRLMIGCMLESRLGMSVAIHFAAGLGVFEFLDLDGHLLTGDTRTVGGFSQSGSRICVCASRPGHGAEVPGG